MYSNSDLNDKLVSELRELAKSLGVSEFDTLRKPDLISRIEEQQNLIESARKAQLDTAEPAPCGKKTQNHRRKLVLFSVPSRQQILNKVKNPTHRLKKAAADLSR